MALGQIKKKTQTLWGSLYLLISLFSVPSLLSQQTSFTPALEGFYFTQGSLHGSPWEKMVFSIYPLLQILPHFFYPSKFVTLPGLTFCPLKM